MKRFFLFFILLFTIISCKTVHSNKTIEQNNTCTCIGIDTTGLFGNIELIKCRNDSIMYFLANKEDTCYSIWETTLEYAIERETSFCNRIYDFNDFFVIEVYCGSEFYFCFNVFSKYNFKMIFRGNLFFISEEKDVILYLDDDTSIKGFFPNQNKYISYKVANSNDLYDLSQSYEGFEVKSIDDSVLEILSNKTGTLNYFPVQK